MIILMGSFDNIKSFCSGKPVLPNPADKKPTEIVPKSKSDHASCYRCLS